MPMDGEVEDQAEDDTCSAGDGDDDSKHAAEDYSLPPPFPSPLYSRSHLPSSPSRPAVDPSQMTTGAPLFLFLFLVGGLWRHMQRAALIVIHAMVPTRALLALGFAAHGKIGQFPPSTFSPPSPPEARLMGLQLLRPRRIL